MKIQLGDKVKCKYTGFIGVVVARTEFLNGCIQYSIAPKWDGKSVLIEEVGIDEDSLEIIKPIKKKVEKEEKEETGGRNHKKINMRGY